MTGITSPRLGISPTSASFGNLLVGQSSQAAGFTVTNSGGAPTIINGPTISGMDASQFLIEMSSCTGRMLAPGESCAVTVRFTPISIGLKSASLSVTSLGSFVAATLTGTGVAAIGVTISPSAAVFGSVLVNSNSEPLTLTVTNSSASDLVYSASVGGADPSQFVLRSPATARSCSLNLVLPAGGGTCTQVIVFAPTSLGSRSATFTVNTGSVPVSAALSGTGVTAAVLTASPAAVSFGSVLPGSQGGIRTIVVTNVGGSTTTLLSTALLGTDAGQFVFTSNSCAGMGLAPAQTCSVALQFVGGAPGSKSASLAVSAANAGSVTVPLAVTVIGWSHQDIGTVGAAGSWSLSGGTHTIRGAGADVWATADAFHYTFVSVTGNATITARVTAVENVHQWTKAMVMMRDGTAANASYMAALAPGLASNQYRQQFRETPGGPSSSNPGGTGAAGGWLRVVRVGGTFSTFFSTDGATWTPLGMPTSITMPSTILVGLGVTSHTLGTLATGTFDNVSVTQP